MEARSGRGQSAPRPLVHWHRAMEIGVPVGSAFGHFCDVDRVSEWVPNLKVLEVMTRTPGGWVEKARFEAKLPHGRMHFSVGCEYDTNGLRVRWSSLPGDPVFFGGSIAFIPLGPRRCLMEFDMYEAPSSHSDEKGTDDTLAVLVAFKRWVERSA